MEDFNELFDTLANANFPIDVISTKYPESLLDTYYNSSIHLLEESRLTYKTAHQFFPIFDEPIDYVNNYKDSYYNLGLCEEALDFLNTLFTRTCGHRLITCKLQPQVPYGTNYYIIICNYITFELADSTSFLDTVEEKEIVRGIETPDYFFIVQQEVGSDIDPDGLADII